MLGQTEDRFQEAAQRWRTAQSHQIDDMYRSPEIRRQRQKNLNKFRDDAMKLGREQEELSRDVKYLRYLKKYYRIDRCWGSADEAC